MTPITIKEISLELKHIKETRGIKRLTSDNVLAVPFDSFGGVTMPLRLVAKLVHACKATKIKELTYKRGEGLTIMAGPTVYQFF